ncbi:elongation factor 1-delta-like [Trichosurus vulpecula]|uniref:elongation factor 1-delta-like n=1 Tax=Trichosurus vulpecula TaxID=9337 RepID=UPI00186AD37F|nr:elongation factor 1-delta-like [Trichosurus vulpecula]
MDELWRKQRQESTAQTVPPAYCSDPGPGRFGEEQSTGLSSSQGSVPWEAITASSSWPGDDPGSCQLCQGQDTLRQIAFGTNLSLLPSLLTEWLLFVFLTPYQSNQWHLPVGREGKRLLATSFLVHEKTWFDKFKYDDAERKLYEQTNGPVPVSPPQSTNTSSSSGSSGDHKAENQSLQSAIQYLQLTISKLEIWLRTLEKCSLSNRSLAPQTQHVFPMQKVGLPTTPPSKKAEDDEGDDDVDLSGSHDEEEDKEAARLREEWLWRSAEKAKRPGLIAKSSILLDVKPWDDETDMAKLDGLAWGGSKLVPVGYGVRKLQIQCVVEDDKMGTDILEEEIAKFQDYVQSADIAAFNKIQKALECV